MEAVVKHLDEKQRHVAVDVGCGSGQFTFELAKYFDHVVGLDVSESQVDEAKRNIDENRHNVRFIIGDERLDGVEDGSANLIGAHAAVGWFDLDTFYPAVVRVLAPGGVLALISYGKPYASRRMQHYEQLQAALTDLLDKVGRRWHKCHESIETEYKTLADLPIPEVEYLRKEHFETDFPGSAEDVVRYVQTLSGYQNRVKKVGSAEAEKPLHEFVHKVKDIMGVDSETATAAAEIPFTMTFAWFGRIGVKPTTAAIEKL